MTATIRIPALSVAIAVAAAAGIATATPAIADTRLLIGMGDSYTTGGGVPGGDDESSGADPCTQSLGSYPLVAADELGFDGQNVACGGARLADFTTTSRRGAPPQTASIAGADIVTFTMGGNDVGGPRGVLESSRTPATMADFAAAVDALGPQLVSAYLDVRRAAPAAEIYVLGYPDIVPATQQALDACLGASAAGLAAADIHHNVTLLNQTIAAAAAEVGSVFVATTPSFAGHEMCTEQPYANASDERAPASPGGALHPNELGHLAMAAALISALGGLEEPGTPGPTDPPAGMPAPPAPGLTPQERAAVRAIAQALLGRLLEDLTRQRGIGR